MKKDKHALVIGCWRILETNQWDLEDLDLLGPAHITFAPRFRGELRLIAMEAQIDWRHAPHTTGNAVEFTWEGHDEGDRISGRGRAEMNEAHMTGRIFIHDGDDFSFIATRQ